MVTVLLYERPSGFVCMENMVHDGRRATMDIWERVRVMLRTRGVRKEVAGVEI